MLQSYAVIRQRIGLKCVIDHLEIAKTTEYIPAQLAYAGCDREIFTEAAIKEVSKFSDGILFVTIHTI